ncbi:hypothetical protein ACM43_11645 [Bradyrhizobium sp. CCBAU 45321]|nr:hypothetical protein [Bradyrhizobium sp. CCBAU 45321]
MLLSVSPPRTALRSGYGIKVSSISQATKPSSLAIDAPRGENLADLPAATDLRTLAATIKGTVDL